MKVRLNWFSTGRGRGGWWARLLAGLGASWRASPVRRLVQVACLAVFAVLFLWTAWPYGPSGQIRGVAGRVVPAELFLRMDPLVGLTAGLAALAWVGSLAVAGVVLAVCLVIPRGFCGYVCPLGTLIDLFDWSAGRHARRLHVRRRGWWVHLKYYVLAGVLLASAFGVMAGGYFAAIPLLTRGLVHTAGPVQLGLTRGWAEVGPFDAGRLLAIGLLVLVLVLGLLGPRFWCRCVCPTGTVFSAANCLRLAERKVESSCIKCGRCVEACPFDAIKADFTTRPADCTFCQTCGGECPVGAIQFAPRWQGGNVKPAGETASLSACDAQAGGEVPVSRRGFLAGSAGALALVGGVRKLFAQRGEPLPRPPGSVPEEMFPRLCVRCGECLRVCPTGVLQPVVFQAGLDGLWTPRLAGDRAGCDPNCANCGRVCPTGAIRPLPLEEKQAVRMGLAIVDATTCLSCNGIAACQTTGSGGLASTICRDACEAAGHRAIRAEIDRSSDGRLNESGEAEAEGLAVPVVDPTACVGCGFCQNRCYSANVSGGGLLSRAAIAVHAGPGREDRLTRGSYRAIRREEARQRELIRQRRMKEKGGSDEYRTDF